MTESNNELELMPENPELLAGIPGTAARPKWSGYFKIVTPEPEIAKQTDAQSLGDQGSYGNYTWYQRLVQGSASRLTRYREYDLMDNDIEVARALDTIAEEMTGNTPETGEPLLLHLVPENEEEVSASIVLTVKTALRRWGYVHNWENRLFKIARTLIKYGDCFFKKQGNYDKWEYLHPKNIIAALVDKNDVTKVLYWQIKVDVKEAKGSYGTPITGQQDTETEFVKASEIVRFTLNDDMSDVAPFGESVLRPVYRSHKQKQLIEDAIIIYRVQRAPERRVFYIDVGKMPPQRVKTYLEQIKNEIKQKKVPTAHGGQSQVESVYNPQSMSEDFFFACISLNTKVFLLDGRTLTLEELISEHKDGNENWTYSIDQKTGKVIPGKIAWAGKTRLNAEMLRVHLDNNETIDCTPDHKFVLRDGSEVEAQYLTSNMSLMPIYKKYQKTNKEQKKELYERIIDNSTGKWRFTHLEIHPKIETSNVIHHLDYNPSNNSPTNLVELTHEDHWKYHHYMYDKGKSQWTEEKKQLRSTQTKEFNIKTKSYCIDDTLFQLFVDEFNNGNNSMPKIKKALVESNQFIKHFGKINKENQNIKNNKQLKFSDKFVYKLTQYGGYATFNDFKEQYAYNHKIVKIEWLPHKEDTGCLHVIDPNNNHNFALASGVYVKNSRPDGRGSRVETLPGGQGLGELADLEYFQNKVLRGLRIPSSYMQEGGEGAVFNDGKVGVAYIQELRFALYCERLQGYVERELDKEFKRFLRQANIKIDESLYKVRLPDPTNFGKYRQQEIDAQLLSTYGSADGISYFSKRFIQKKYLQMTDEEIVTNERMIREEKGLNPDGGQEDFTAIYWTAGEEGSLGGGGLGGLGGLGGGLGGDLGGEEAGMEAGEVGGTPGRAAGETPGGAPGG